MRNIYWLILFISLILYSHNVNASIYFDFEKKWKQVEIFELKDLPKSALLLVDSIYHQAKEENNRDQIVKSLIYQSKFTLVLEEDAELKIFKRFEEEIDLADGYYRNILQSVFANLLQEYFSRYRWQYLNRMQISGEDKGNDFRIWDAASFMGYITDLYLNSLKNKDLLKEIPQSDLKFFILDSNKELSVSSFFEPSLFDILSQNALDFFKKYEKPGSRSFDSFAINSKNHFLNYKIERNQTEDEQSYKEIALNLYQDLIDFYFNVGQETASAYWLIDRLDYVENSSEGLEVFPNYNRALFLLIDKFEGLEIESFLRYKLAYSYYEYARMNEKLNDLGLENYYVKSIESCDKAIFTFPESIGAKFAVELKEKISAPFSELDFSGVVPSQTPTRVVVNYKNLDSLTFKIFRLTPSNKSALRSAFKREDKDQIINQLNEIHQWTEGFVNPKDHTFKMMETMIPALDFGSYLMLSLHPIDEVIHGYSFFDVSDISFFKQDLEGKSILKILDRTTGKPISNVEVNLSTSNINAKGINFGKKFYSDEKGIVSIDFLENVYGLKIDLINANDSIRFENLSLYKNNNVIDDDEINVKAFIFTDRQIYRPGQKIYFKGILVKNKAGISEIVKRESLVVSLIDPNGITNKEIKISTNNYGSFSGEFEIPTSGLTGEYEIEVEEDYEVESKFFDHEDVYFDYSTKRIDVEEYKRPRFEVIFAEIKERFELNDSVKLQVYVRAYSGNYISSGEVIYRVFRTTKMYPRYDARRGSRYYPIGTRQEIVYGKTNTDLEGNFEIVFHAIPDESFDRKDLPVFEYVVEVEVTDINGETRASQKSVNIGYHSMILEANVSDEITRNSTEEKIVVSAMNLNQQETKAKGTIEVFKKSYSNRVTAIPNQMVVPDFPRWSANEFEELFPIEPYAFDESIANATNAKKVAFMEFNTANSKEVVFKDYRDWEPGAYFVKITSFDSLGTEITIEKDFELIDFNHSKVSDNKLFQIFTDKKSYQVNDKVHLRLGSAAKDLTVYLQVEKRGKIVMDQAFNLSEEIKEIKIPVDQSDEGGFVIHYFYAYGNKSVSDYLRVPVEGQLKPIKIVTESFRNLLSPGAKETWSFKIVGQNKDKFASEVLVGMYDLSLDQLSYFPNRWAFDPNKTLPYYPSCDISNGNSFLGASFHSFLGSTYSYLNENRLPSINQFDQFGFSLVPNSAIGRGYLSSLKAKFLESKVIWTSDSKIPAGFVKGLVTDVFGLPLEFAVVSVIGIDRSVNTNAQGEFYIQVEEKNEILVRFPFYKSEIIRIGKDNKLHVMLVEEINELDQITVTGYGSKEKRSISIRGASSLTGSVSEVSDDAPVLEARAMGVNVDYNVPPPSIIDFDQSVSDKMIINQVKIRSDFKETAFFYPHLETNKKGEFGFSFDAPESLTTWKLMLLSHSKNLRTAYSEAEVVTQKELMITPNFPRFLRQGDKVVLAAKISNLSPKNQKGKAQLSFVNELTGQNEIELEKIPVFEFEVKPFESITVDWEIEVPDDLQLLQYKVLALTEDFSDGEQSILPVLEKKILVTETMPVWANQGDNKRFSFDKLKNPNSETIKNHKLSFELTTNPLWYVLQTIPYIDDLSDENSEQLLSRVFVNALGLQLVSTIPELKSILGNWANGNIPEDQFAKNKDLRSIILEETPWLKEAESDENKMKRLVQLLDSIKLKNSIAEDLQKLKSFQMSDGGFVWYKGSKYSNFQMTNHILQSFGKLKRMNVEFSSVELDQMIEKGLSFLQEDLIKKFDKHQKEQELKSSGNASNYLSGYELGSRELDVMYTLLVNDTSIDSEKLIEVINFYTIQLQSNWVALDMSDRIKAVRILEAFDKNEYKSILESILENSISSEEMGNYWKLENTTMSWANSPTEIHGQMIDLFKEFGEQVHSKEQNGKFIDDLVKWLLKQKQTNHWPTSKSTVSAVSAIYNNYSSWSGKDFEGEVIIGEEIFLESNSNAKYLDAGYLKKTWNQKDITTEMADVSIVNNGETVFWGALYWQYFEDIDQISKSNGVVEISKELFTKINTPTGIQFVRISEENTIKIGDLVKVRIEVKLDRDIDFVHLSDQRASGLEPIQVLSGYKFQNGVGYYESHKDATTHFYFDSLKKGIYVFEYEVRASQAGNFANGITKIESVYAPEFKSHTPGQRLKIK
ncbi:MG2 domain-containing protein [Belliella sp. R4-6]|uniref:MG2 domain-containing protein n=1 Tax=Belliella alkalica TaxID=1730871 RepID=A0ABS9V756_9BACT|nr:alpha-2-macroglobulin family protein [Belliella alkalica]MCH7412251.1 MG2 domain-containing protein [Belliella alkalica]